MHVDWKLFDLDVVCAIKDFPFGGGQSCPGAWIVIVRFM